MLAYQNIFFYSLLGYPLPCLPQTSHTSPEQNEKRYPLVENISVEAAGAITIAITITISIPIAIAIALTITYYYSCFQKSLDQKLQKLSPFRKLSFLHVGLSKHIFSILC